MARSWFWAALVSWAAIVTTIVLVSTYFADDGASGKLPSVVQSLR